MPGRRPPRVVGPIPGLRDARARAVNAVELIAELDGIFATRTLDEWAQVFAGEPDFFWSPVNTLEDVVADEQFHAAGGIVDVPDGESSVPMVPRRPISTARPGHRVLRHRNSDSTPRKFSPNSRRAAVVTTGENFTDFSPNITLSGEPRHPIHRAGASPGAAQREAAPADEKAHDKRCDNANGFWRVR